jgi:hypothetical protein
MPPTCRCASRRRLAIGLALLLSLLIYFAWTASRPSPSEQTRQPRQPASQVAHTAPGLGQGVQPTTAGAPLGRSPAIRLSLQRVLKYGRAEGEIGMVQGQGQAPVGPESFALGKDGRILVADVVNQRLVVYSTNGTFVRNIDLPGIALGDIATDVQGQVFVYDQVARALHLYDAHGTPRGKLSLNPVDINTRGYFHVSGNAVYFADAAVRDVLVATVQDGALTPADKTLERAVDGIHGDSGRIYSLALDKGQALRLQVRDPAGQSAARSLEVPLAGIVSARYAGEDSAQRFYVQTERLEGSGIALELLAFSPAGDHLATTRMPENDYFIWTAKLVDVRADGAIVQFLPQRDQARLNIFTN